MIRHLFLNYFPFLSRLKSAQAKVYDPHTLVGLTVLKHDLTVLHCAEELPPTATRRVQLDLTLGKLKPSKSLWEADQVSRNQNNEKYTSGTGK